MNQQISKVINATVKLAEEGKPEALITLIDKIFPDARPKTHEEYFKSIFAYLLKVELRLRALEKKNGIKLKVKRSRK